MNRNIKMMKLIWATRPGSPNSINTKKMAKDKAKKNATVNNSPESYIKTRARNLPIGKCYINESWKEKGFATIIVSREHINGNYTYGVYLVDLYCLGVKDTFYDFNQYDKYIELVDRLNENETMMEIDYALVHNIIYGAVEYAKDLGFKPGKNFGISQYLLQEDDERVELIDIEFGLNGKPAIFMWKEAHPANVIATLERNVGKGNFTVFSGGDIEDENEEDDYEDDDFDDEDAESFTEEDIIAILDGKKKTSVRNKTRLTFAMFQNASTEEERMEMDRIMDEVYSWQILDDDETGEPAFMSEKNKSTYKLMYKRVEENSGNTINDIEALVAEHPDEYHFHNLLSIAYGTLGDKNKEYEIVASTYEKFPDKVFAFTNYLMTFGESGRQINRARPIDGEFDFHKLFPQRENLTMEELLSLTSALFFYFTEEQEEYHKGIAYVMPLCRFIFYGNNKVKANQILLFVNKCMLQEIIKRNGLDEDMSEEIDKEME